MHLFYVLCSVCLVVWFLLIWLLGNQLRLGGAERWVFQGGLWLIGTAVALLLLYFRRLKTAVAVDASPSSIVTDLRFAVREADQRLRRMRNSRSARSISTMPLIMFVGDTGTAKTVLIENSGLHPELLSGNSRQSSPPPPTTSANLWLVGDTVVAELGGALLADEQAVRSAMRLLGPRGWRNRLGLGTHASRSVVLCVDAGLLKTRDAQTSMSAVAKRYHELLGEFADAWANALPVYVIFTRTDQLAWFTDYVARFKMDEANEAFGFTLPVGGSDGEAWHNWQNQRLATAFERIFVLAASYRLELLHREEDISRRSNVYEFPRELRKISDLGRQFLVDVCRPSQLRASPFLRGFYFTGVRPVVVQDAAAVLSTSGVPDLTGGGFMTQSVGRSAVAPIAERQKRVPHWSFVNGLFTSVLLGDQVGRATSRLDMHAGVARRMAFGGVTALAAMFLTGATVSWARHRELLQSVAAASSRLQSAGTTDLSSDRWQDLEVMRRAAQDVSSFHRNRPPLSFRWGLYGGEPLYRNVRSAWCREFDRVVLAPMRTGMEQELERLPVSADQSADYDRHFNLLKAYLMLTAKPGETTPRFLEDALAERYAQNRHIPAEATEVARRQFRFLAAEQRAGVCAAPANDASVSRARRYLWSFQPLDRIYGNIVAAVSAGRPPFRFADPSGAVSAPHEIASIYTAQGFPQAASAIQNAQDYFNREPWVLGPPPQQSLIVNDLRDQLTKRYTDDYIAQWSKLLQSASVAGYPGLKQALPKLQSIAGTQSPLLLLFCEISTNTAIASAQVTAAFQPFHTLEPPATCANKLNDAPTEEYMMALARIQFQLEELVKKPDAPEVSLDSVNAKVAAQNTARRANLPAKAAELLLAPIVYAERLETRLAPDVLNASGADFCRSTAIFRKFPFDAKSGQQATLEEVRQVFQAESGSLWKFYESTLQAVIVPGSGGFTSKPGAKVKVTPEFLSFFNRAAAFSSSVFRSGADPSLSYTIQAKPSPGVASFTLDISGKTLTGSESGGEAQEFIWTGGVDTVRLTPKLTSGTIPEPLAISGVWAVIDLLTRQGMLSANNTISEIEVSGGRTGRGNAKTVTTVRLSAETKKGGSLLSLTPRGCVSQIAR